MAVPAQWPGIDSSAWAETQTSCTGTGKPGIAFGAPGELLHWTTGRRALGKPDGQQSFWQTYV